MEVNMKKIIGFYVFLLLGIFLTSAALAEGIDINDTRMLHQPAISQTHIAFEYAAEEQSPLFGFVN